MSANTQENIPVSSLDHSEDEFIPHMIYMLSFVMNVGEHYSKGTNLDEGARDKLRTELGLSVGDAEKLKTAFSEESIGRLSVVIDRQFKEGPYTKAGCPAKLDTLIILAMQWRAGAALSLLQRALKA